MSEKCVKYCYFADSRALFWIWSFLLKKVLFKEDIECLHKQYLSIIDKYSKRNVM